MQSECDLREPTGGGDSGGWCLNVGVRLKGADGQALLGALELREVEEVAQRAAHGELHRLPPPLLGPPELVENRATAFAQVRLNPLEARTAASTAPLPLKVIAVESVAAAAVPVAEQPRRRRRVGRACGVG